MSKSKLFICVATVLIGLYALGISSKFIVLAVTTNTEVDTTSNCLSVDSATLENCSTEATTTESSTDSHSETSTATAGESSTDSHSESSSDSAEGSSSPISALANTFGINTKLLIGQLINFAIVILAFYKFVVKPVAVSMQNRTDKITAGLKMAEKVQSERDEFVKSQEAQTVALAKKEKAIIASAEERAKKIIEEATEKAKEEANTILDRAHAQTETEFEKAKVELKKMTFEVASTIATKVLQREIKLTNKDPLIENNLN